MFGTSFRAACSHAAKARSTNQSFRRSANGTISTVGSSIRDRLSAASTEMIRLRLFDGDYPVLPLGFSTSLLSASRFHSDPEDSLDVFSPWRNQFSPDCGCVAKLGAH
jgi:hypothetical protein